jgi:site-specific DNA-methyltransferase (cytosine-N4-specific)
MLPSSLASRQIYRTKLGSQLVGDSSELLSLVPEGSVDLIMTSPPFALLREKSYGNKEQHEYVSWLLEFGRAALPTLKDTGSFVVDLGGSYQRGKAVRSLYQWRVLLAFCDTLGYRLAEEFYWHNPAKLPSPIEWVNKRKIRVKDSVNTVWWFSKGDWPKADVTKVLAPYSDRMKKLIANPDAFYRPKDRPSGHDISRGFATDNGGAIPPNLLTLPNTESNSSYIRLCKALGRDSHPARFPIDLPSFFIKFLTEPGDVVVDIFSGSNTTGRAAEDLGRRWISIDERRDYAALSALRFMDPNDIAITKKRVEEMEHSAVDLSDAVDRASPDTVMDEPPQVELPLLAVKARGNSRNETSAPRIRRRK